MSEKIPQHRHCSKCGKAFIGEDRYCSEECKIVSSQTLKKRKRQLIYLYAISLIVLFIVLLYMGTGI
jgi:predicted nucleic acid-binding Zn ribbon protein